MLLHSLARPALISRQLPRHPHLSALARAMHTDRITHVSGVSQLNGILDKSKDKLSLIDFHATWCGPCKAIAPHFEKWSTNYKNVNFLKVDVDQAQDVAQKYSVRAMPTFVFLKGQTEVDRIQGANISGVEAALRRHSSGSSDSFSGKGQTLGGGPAVAGGTDGGGIVALQGLDPQTKVLLGLLGGYLLFWYLSSS